MPFRRVIVVSALFALLLAPAMGKGQAKGPATTSGVDSYYTVKPMFHPYPGIMKQFSVPRFGPVGISIELTEPAFGMKVGTVEKGSPAEATGKLKKGQIIERINGQVLKDVDPRLLLGKIITEAEATDGVVKLLVKNTPAAPAEEVVVKIPVLGAYSQTWPLNCPKSDKIVRGMAEWLAKTGNHAGPGTDLGLLFLLSTGEEKDLAVARGWVKELIATKNNDKLLETYPWFVGYSGIGLAEYYLRTGDAAILPVLEKLAVAAQNKMYNGGWSGCGRAAFTYVGGGHLNAAGVHVVTFLLLAKECGVKVDERTLQESLRQMYRFAGRGNTAYGDHFPEGGFVDNGKVGGLAFTMAAATTLTPEGEQSVYAKARDISAVKGFYSTSWMLHGHTGGGIGEIWRSASMGLMFDKKPTKYREFMDGRMWFYDLSRRYDGSFGILGGGRYDNPDWGTGLALSYTIPRKTLQITGAPPSKFARSYQLPKRPWGTAADDVFYSLVPAPDKNGKVSDVDSEKLPTDASMPVGNRLLNDPKVTDETLLQYARHPDQGIREMAADAIAKHGRDHLILELLHDKNPRARHSGTQVLYGTFKRAPVSPERLTDPIAQRLWQLVADPNESWWVTMNALRALSLGRPAQIAPHLSRVLDWLGHEEWWLSRSALMVVAKIPLDETNAKIILPAVGAYLTRMEHHNGIGPMREVMAQIKQSSPAIQQAALQMLGKAYLEFPATVQAPGAPEFFLGSIASHMVQLPDGYDKLFAVFRKRFPNQSLPHAWAYQKANPAKFGPALREAVLAESQKGKAAVNETEETTNDDGK